MRRLSFFLSFLKCQSPFLPSRLRRRENIYLHAPAVDWRRCTYTSTSTCLQLHICMNPRIRLEARLWLPEKEEPRERASERERLRPTRSSSAPAAPKIPFLREKRSAVALFFLYSSPPPPPPRLRASSSSRANADGERTPGESRGEVSDFEKSPPSIDHFECLFC